MPRRKPRAAASRSASATAANWLSSRERIFSKSGNVGSGRSLETRRKRKRTLHQIAYMPTRFLYSPRRRTSLPLPRKHAPTEAERKEWERDRGGGAGNQIRTAAGTTAGGI